MLPIVSHRLVESLRNPHLCIALEEKGESIDVRKNFAQELAAAYYKIVCFCKFDKADCAGSWRSLA